MHKCRIRRSNSFFLPAVSPAGCEGMWEGEKGRA